MPSVRTPQPQTYNADFAADPPKALAALILTPHWLLWKWELDERGKWTKPPYRSTNPKKYAKSDDPKTWSDRQAAVTAVLAKKADGIGFALTDTEFGAVDLDHCRDPKTGAYDAWAQKILDAAPNAYNETTVSGTGLRIIGIATGREVHRAFTLDGGGRIEIFRRATRYITISGLQIGNCSELPILDELIDDLVAQYDGAEHIIDRIIRFGVPEGQRSEAFGRVVWSLAGKGYTQKQIEEELSKYPDGIAAKYAERLAAEIDRCYSKWWKENDSFTVPSSPHSWDDPDISILDDRRGELPVFPLDVLSASWQQWATNAAHGAGCAVDYVMVPAICWRVIFDRHSETHSGIEIVERAVHVLGGNRWPIGVWQDSRPRRPQAGTGGD
jgi:hypothetical protein